METLFIRLAIIVTTAGTQVRAKIDESTVEQYAAEKKEGAEFPPVVVFHDGNQFILADGFHRVMASARNGDTEVYAQIHKGTKSDALKFALIANATHGLKRTNADKRRSVELALIEWPNLSNRELEKVCAVSDSLVADVRVKTQVPESGTCPPKRIGGDGKQYKAPAPKSSTITPEKAKALMANVESEPAPATQEPQTTEPERIVAPSAYSLQQFKETTEGEVEIAIEEFAVKAMTDAAGHLEMLAAKLRHKARAKAMKEAA